MNIKCVLERLSEKGVEQSLFARYYEGDHPLVFSTDKLRDVLKVDPRARSPFTENWISVVVDSVTERLRMTGFSVGDGTKEDARAKRLNELYDNDAWALLADDVHQSIEVMGEAFVIVQQTDTGLEAYAQNAACCLATYDPARPKRLQSVAKAWQDHESAYLVLYEEKTVTTYRAPLAKASDPAAYVMDEEGPVAVDAMPVFHFAASKKGLSPIKSAIPLQDAINKQFADMVATSDFCAFPFRYFVTNAALPPRMPMAPGDFVTIPAGDSRSEPAQIGQFPAADLGVYTNSMDRTASVMAAITRTPKHYFVKQGGDPSGEALQAMEAPLIAKVRRRMERTRPVWAQFAAYCARLVNLSIDPEEITVNYDDCRTIQSLSQAQTRAQNVTAGIPILTQLRDEGWRQSELDQLEKDKQGERGTVEQLPVDPAQAQAVTEANIAPLVEKVVTLIGDVAMAKLIDSGKMEQLAALASKTAAP